MKKLITLIIFLFSNIFSNAQSPSAYCANMGDNRLDSWIGAVSGNQTAPPVEKGYFRFKNSQDGRVSFTYGNFIIDLPPNGLSIPIKGDVPRSLPDCNVKIDNIHLSEFYKVVDYEVTYQKFSENASRMHVNRFKASEGELKAGITSCNQTLKEIEFYISKMPNYFMRKYDYESKFNLTKVWREALQDELNKKQTSSGNTNKSNSSSTSTSQNTTISTSRNSSSQSGNISTSSQIYRNEQHQLQEEEAARRLAELNRSNAETEALANAVGSGIEQFGNLIAGSMQARMAQEERSRLKTVAYYETRQKEGEKLVRDNLSAANMGNEKAIMEVIKGHQLIGINDNYLTFAHQMVNKHNSNTAINSLKSYYNGQKLRIKQESNRHVRRGITKLLIGGLVVGGASYASNYILENKDIYADPDASAMYDATEYIAVGAIVITVISSGISFFKVGYKNDKKYLDADNKIFQLDQKAKLSLSPAYFKWDNIYGLTLSLKF